MLVRIDAEVNDEPKNLIVDVMEENYYFFLAHHISELICLCYRADDASRATLISGTAVAVPGGNRLRRGRDRRLLHSGFGMYSMGL